MSSARPFQQHVRISSMDDLSYAIPASGSEGTNDAIQTIVTGRKCWKTMKGKGEVVWPPYLEAALVEGLEKYRPVETRSTKALGRFPMRNKFISDYIYNTTGKRRTPKQVGSRLQQLRDTCEGKRILKLLSSRHESPDAAKSEEGGSPPLRQTPEATTSTSPPRDIVTIDVLPAHAPWHFADPTSHGSQARPLRAIDPTVTFRSRSPMAGHSSYRVLKNGVVVHAEVTELEMRSSSCMPAAQWPSEMECTFLYSTTLVPQYWQYLCECSDLSPYTIEQDLFRVVHASQSTSTTSESQQSIILSVVYQFNTPNSFSPPLSPTSTSVAGDSDIMTFSGESSPELGPDLDDLAMFNAIADPTASAISGIPPMSQHQHLGAGAYQLPPDLIRDGEEGYASLPPSPLDMVFGSETWAKLPESICRSYVDLSAQQSACFDSIPNVANMPFQF